MQYMLLIYSDAANWAKLTDSQRSEMTKDFAALSQAMVKAGQMRGGARLEAPSAATTVRQVSGKTATTDGPFAETREHLGGYFLVECKDLDEVLSIAGRIPSLRIGDSVEVRPVVAMPQA
jgi:hypothetical protein